MDAVATYESLTEERDTLAPEIVSTFKAWFAEQTVGVNDKLTIAYDEHNQSMLKSLGYACTRLAIVCEELAGIRDTI